MTGPGARRRALLAAVPHLLGVAPALGTLVTWRDRLPDPLASHFGPAGIADGFMSPGAFLAGTAALGLGMALLFGLCTRGLPTQSAPAASSIDAGRWFIGISWATAAFLGTIMFAVVAANLELTDATAATMPAWTFPLGLLAAAAAGVAGWLVAPRTQGTEPADRPAPVLRLGTSEQVSWSRDVGSRWLPVVAAGLVAGGIALGVALSWLAGISTAGAGILVLLLGSARATVNRRGFTAALGLLGWPRVHIPVDEITSATVAEVSPAEFGGWGYRIVPGGRGIITRSGPALVITRNSGPRLTITVDDAETAAGLLNGLTARG